MITTSNTDPPGRSMRILVTGSRLWTDRAVIYRELNDVLMHACVDAHLGPSEVTVVHGAARGADTLADSVAKELGMIPERHPVTGETWRAPCRVECKPGHRKIGGDGRDYCPAAGHYRNQRMVDLGADVCLALVRGRSSGTMNCVTKARDAGISVRIVSQET